MINRPEVFKSPVSDTYIMFGEAKVSPAVSRPAVVVLMSVEHLFILLLRQCNRTKFVPHFLNSKYNQIKVRNLR